MHIALELQKLAENTTIFFARGPVVSERVSEFSNYKIFNSHCTLYIFFCMYHAVVLVPRKGLTPTKTQENGVRILAYILHWNKYTKAINLTMLLAGLIAFKRFIVFAVLSALFFLVGWIFLFIIGNFCGDTHISDQFILETVRSSICNVIPRSFSCSKTYQPNHGSTTLTARLSVLSIQFALPVRTKHALHYCDLDICLSICLRLGMCMERLLRVPIHPVIKHSGCFKSSSTAPEHAVAFPKRGVLEGKNTVCMVRICSVFDITCASTHGL